MAREYRIPVLETFGLQPPVKSILEAPPTAPTTNYQVANKKYVDDNKGLATVKFRDLADSKDIVTASLDGSERTSVTLDET